MRNGMDWRPLLIVFRFPRARPSDSPERYAVMTKTRHCLPRRLQSPRMNWLCGLSVSDSRVCGAVTRDYS
jgi:hypothetical protein